MTTADLVEVADYASQAREFLVQAREYLAGGRLHKASEHGWDAAAYMAKAVATAQGWEYDAHDGFSVVLNRARRLTGDGRLGGLRATANDLHSNYYRRKRHLDAERIDEDIERVAQLLGILAPLTTPSH